MAPDTDGGLSDEEKMLFGAGFVFGVMVTLLLLALTLVAVTRGSTTVDGLLPSALVTVAGGVVFAAVVGAGLYYLAFPENRTTIPVDPEQFGLDDEE
jgi:predicted membrane channel-forming protein YqfA (hemolysin III family)